MSDAVEIGGGGRATARPPVAALDDAEVRPSAPPRLPRAPGFWPSLTILLMLGPVVAGLAGTALPALGYLPPLGGDRLSLAAFEAFFATPGIDTSIRLSVTTGLLATLISLIATMAIVAATQGTRAFGLVERALSPLLSVPHAAAAFGLAFLVAPSGWIARGLSPGITGWERPPDLLIVGDPAGLALVAGLVAKEVPFLLLMTIAALGQADARRTRLVALTTGHGPMAGWAKTVLPAVYAQIRLPVFAVLAYSMSVVDVARILGPTTPPPLSVLLVEWMMEADLSLRFRAAAGAMVQVGLVGAGLLIWLGLERMAAALGRAWISAGWRHAGDGLLRLATQALALALSLGVIAGLAGLALWSVAGLWRFPDFWPSGLQTRVWMREAPGIATPALSTAVIALVAAVIALLLAIACLETEHRRGGAAIRRNGAHTTGVPGDRALWLLYLPLMVPQTGFLFGLQIATSWTGMPPGLAIVMLGHLVFVLPYVFLSLSGPWRAWDGRQAVSAAVLGASPWRVLCQVRLPMLLAPLLTALAVGIAVSISQYLPTLLLGAGRVSTLTTEAVALSAGGDRRVIGVWALMQALAPLPAFLLALGLPALIWRRRRGMTSHA
ncbi:MAG: ABC transporter permease [Pseudomonadota bacterium]